MLEDLFCNSFFTVKCILKNKINEITLINICAIRYGFINEKVVKIIYQTPEMETQRLTKPKPIQRFDNRVVRLVIYAIYPILFIKNHIESVVFLVITKLG